MLPWAKFTKKEFRSCVHHIIGQFIGVMAWRSASNKQRRKVELADRAYAASEKLRKSRKLRTPKTKVPWKLRA